MRPTAHRTLRSLADEYGMREPPRMEVRSPRHRDLEEVIAIWHETRKETHTAIGIEMERGLTLADSRRIFLEHIAPHCRLWVAEKDGTLHGFMAIRGSYIDRMYVRPSVQRCGVGGALLEKARQLSPAGLELHTHQKNRRARNFYEKHGFCAVQFGVSPAPENEPDVQYEWIGIGSEHAV